METLEQSIQTQEHDEKNVGLSDDIIRAIVTAEQEETPDIVLGLVENFSPAEFAELLEKVDETSTKNLALIFQSILPADALSYMRHDTARQILRQFPHTRVTKIIAELDTDDAIDLLEPFSKEEQKDILRGVSRQIRVLVEEGLSYPEDSAGRLMHRDFVAIPRFWTIGKTFDYLRGLKEDLPADLYNIFIVDPTHSVVGLIRLVDLLKEDRTKKIMSLTLKEPRVIPVNMDQEDVAFLFKQNALISAPVVDEDGRLIGVITVDDVINVVQEEAEEDILRLAGVQEGDIDRKIIGTATSRFSWLAINLITAILASLAIGFFEATLSQVVALAILMPIVASMGGNAGTQTLTVAVRALATKELSSTNAWRVIRKETLVGLLNGSIFAFLGAAIAWIWFHDLNIALVIAIAMILNLLVAGLFGVLIPMCLERIKIDPALASSVFLTTLTDIVGFVVFLGLATYLLM